MQGQSDVLDHADDQDRVVNTAMVHHPGDTNADNDTDQAALPVPRPDLAITKDDGVDVVTAGTETTYELVASNHGEGAAVGAVLTDTLPEGTEFVAASSGATAEDGVVTWSGIDLDPGESQPMTVTLRVSAEMAADESITNTAVLAHEADADPTDNRDDDTDTVVDPDPPQISRQPAAPAAPRPDRPTGFLPRTGAELANWVWVAAALMGLGGAAWVNDRFRNP